MRSLCLTLLLQLTFEFSRGFCPPPLHCLNGQNDKISVIKSNITASTSPFFKKLAFKLNFCFAHHWPERKRIQKKKKKKGSCLCFRTTVSIHRPLMFSSMIHIALRPNDPRHCPSATSALFTY